VVVVVVVAAAGERGAGSETVVVRCVVVVAEGSTTRSLLTEHPAVRALIARAMRMTGFMIAPFVTLANGRRRHHVARAAKGNVVTGRVCRALFIR
jgi:hypothetical protein